MYVVSIDLDRIDWLSNSGPLYRNWGGKDFPGGAPRNYTCRAIPWVARVNNLFGNIFRNFYQKNVGEINNKGNLFTYSSFEQFKACGL